MGQKNRWQCFPNHQTIKSDGAFVCSKVIAVKQWTGWYFTTKMFLYKLWHALFPILDLIITISTHFDHVPSNLFVAASISLGKQHSLWLDCHFPTYRTLSVLLSELGIFRSSFNCFTKRGCLSVKWLTSQQPWVLSSHWGCIILSEEKGNLPHNGTMRRQEELFLIFCMYFWAFNLQRGRKCERTWLII